MDKTAAQKKINKEKMKKKKLDRIYEKKPLVEFIVATLSIPSIILLLILNFNSLRSINAKPTPTPTPTISVPGANQHFFVQPVSRAPRPTQSPLLTQAPCNKNLGPVSITSPNEGATIGSNPVEIDIAYDDMDYCSAVWSYRINGGSWSDYDNRSVALYNLPNGSITFELRVKSLTSSDTTTLTRNFFYNGQSNLILPTNASGSAH